jgi:hypothetical protein
MHRPYIPLSQRPAVDLRAESERYQAMAETARTAVARRGLQALALRLAARADEREATEQMSPVAPATSNGR